CSRIDLRPWFYPSWTCHGGATPRGEFRRIADLLRRDQYGFMDRRAALREDVRRLVSGHDDRAAGPRSDDHVLSQHTRERHGLHRAFLRLPHLHFAWAHRTQGRGAADGPGFLNRRGPSRPPCFGKYGIASESRE